MVVVSAEGRPTAARRDTAALIRSDTRASRSGCTSAAASTSSSVCKMRTLYMEVGLNTPHANGSSFPLQTRTGSPARGVGRPNTRSMAPP